MIFFSMSAEWWIVDCISMTCVRKKKNLWIENRQKQKAFFFSFFVRRFHSKETFEPEIDLLFSLLLIRSVDSSLSNISKKKRELLMDTHFLEAWKKKKKKSEKQHKSIHTCCFA